MVFLRPVLVLTVISTWWGGVQTTLAWYSNFPVFVLFYPSGITVSVKVTFSVGEDVYKPSETDKLPKDEKVFLEDTYSKDFEIFQVHREIDNDDVEVIDIACCPRIMYEL